MIHKFADVQTDNIGNGTNIWQFCVVLKGAAIGKECNINANVFIENDVSIGDRVTVKCGVQVWDGITLEDDVFVGPNATFTNDNLPRSKQYPEAFARVIIKKGASLGANCTIIGGIVVGEYSMIGAGSVVTKDIGNNELWYGNPAEFKGFICRCGKKCDESLVCVECVKSDSIV